MGVVGNTIGSAIGNMASRALAKKYLGNDYVDQSALIGSTLGGLAGGLLPFKNGGKIPGKKGEALVIIGHGQEWVLPNGVNPTKKQISLIEKRKKQKREKKVELFV